jgi:ribosomal protein L37AE/L43A
MSFEDIPENREEGGSCPNCIDGYVTMNVECTLWQCDNCDFERTVIPKSTE